MDSWLQTISLYKIEYVSFYMYEWNILEVDVKQTNKQTKNKQTNK